MRLIPLLMRPTILGAKNRICSGGCRSLKEATGALVSIGMISAMYLTTRAALNGSADLIHSGALNPFAPLSLLLTSLFCMVSLSSAVAAIGSLFLSRDLDLLLSSPLSLGRFLFGRCCDVALSTSWMVCVFGLQSLVAFGQFFGCGVSFFLAAPVLCLVCILVAVMLGVFGALVFGTLVPPQRGRGVLLALFMLSLLFFFVSLNSPAVSHRLLTTSFSANAALLDSASQLWSPGFFWASAILDLREGKFAHAGAILAASCALVAALWVAARSLASRFYASAYARLRNEGESLKLNSRGSQAVSRRVFGWIRADRRALVTKEYKVFARDLTHTIQLSMLLAVCFIYLYNFRALEAPATAEEDVQTMWHLLLLIVNVALSFLVIVCICSRFVFPSISLEGTSFWILQSAPVSMRNVLRAKVLSWFLPMSIIAAVIFMSGAMAIGADELLVLASCACGVILAYGLVGLGVGLGALFAHFEWEYSSQVTTNVGSFLYMALSLLFLAVNLVPIILMFGAYSLVPGLIPHESSPLIILGSGLLLLAAVNYSCVAASLSVGSRSLKAR